MGGLRQGHQFDESFLKGNEMAEIPIDGAAGGMHTEARREISVVGRWGSAPLDMPEHGRPGFEPRFFFEELAQDVSDSA